MTLPALSLLETRVLSVLIEKQHTVPDTYPLTLLALSAGCNQKSSRDPVLDAAEAEVQAAVDSLKRLSLVIETSGGRVMRYAHNFGRVFDVPPQAAALLAVLMLRGPQTVGELRINAERLHRFADISSVDAFLRELAARPAGVLVVELPRQPGSREPRWAHLLSGTPAIIETPVASTAPPASETVAPGEIAALRANVAQLTTELAKQQVIVSRLCKELGIPEGRQNMTIEHWQGSAKGRNRAVRHGGVVYTVATAPGADIQSQTRAALAAIDANLSDAGSDKTRLISVQIFLADISQKAGMDDVWNDWIGADWQNWPQRACVGAPLAGDTLVEIVVTAAAKP